MENPRRPVPNPFAFNNDPIESRADGDWAANPALDLPVAARAGKVTRWERTMKGWAFPWGIVGDGVEDVMGQAQGWLIQFAQRR